MSTSILYHGFGVRAYRYLKTEYREGSLIFHIEKSPEKQCCAECGSRKVIKKGHFVREMRTLPIGRKRVFLVVHLHRLLCRSCGALKLEPLLLSFPKKRWTKMLGRYVVDLLKRATVEDVARHLGMSWNTVKEIHTWALKRKFRGRRIRHLRYLGVDEIAVRKSHRYLTVVVDLESGQVVWVSEGREISSLEPFLRRLRRARAPIEAIAMDMWQAYISAALKHYPYEAIVFDRYHVISDYNKLLDELRRKEVAAAPEHEKKVYVGVRYLLLKGKEKIKDRTTAKQKLDRLLKLNQSLNTAYVLKEELRELWNCDTRQEAEEYLRNWLQTAWSSGIKLLIKFANKLAGHRYGILNYFDNRITTARVEGLNNKIKVLKRQAYGYRDMEYFKLRIYFLHESRYALVG
jgi:transposase